MGEAKRKQTGKAMSPEERDIALGNDPFVAAYKLVFGMVDTVFSATGGVNHELIGIDFDAGKPTGVNVLVVRRIEDVPRLREEMLLKWPLVAHVFEAWAAPDTSTAPSVHPMRYDVVNVALHTADMAAVAMCRANAELKTVEKAELMYPDQIGGRLGRVLPTRH